MALCMFVWFVSYANAQNAFTQSTFYRDLTIGSSGLDVIQLQNFLKTSGFLTMPASVGEGYFGNLTKEALIQYQLSKDIQPASGYFGSKTRAVVIHDETSIAAIPSTMPGVTVSTYSCPTGYVCATATSTSVSVTQGNVSFPTYTTGNIIGTYSSGSTAATWVFSFTVSSTSSSPIYISATPNAAVQIASDLPGVPGVSGLAAGTMPLRITPADGPLPGDTDSGSGVTATGSFIVPPNSNRNFIVTVIENNYNNPSADGGASIQITGVYYNRSATPRGTMTPASSEALCTVNLPTLHSTPVTLQGNGGAVFYVSAPTVPTYAI